MTNVHWMGFEVGLCPRLYTKKIEYSSLIYIPKSDWTR